MAITIRIEIVSAEAKIFSGSAELLVAMGEMGELGIASGHTPLLTTLKPGQLRVIHNLQNPENNEELFYVSGGMLEVQPHIATVLADTVVRAADLDEAKAKEAKARALDKLAERKSEFDYAEATAELAAAIAQLQTIQRLRKKHK